MAPPFAVRIFAAVGKTMRREVGWLIHPTVAFYLEAERTFKTIFQNENQTISVWNRLQVRPEMKVQVAVFATLLVCLSAATHLTEKVIAEELLKNMGFDGQPNMKKVWIKK